MLRPCCSSVLQAVALALFLPFDGLISLYVVSGVFGLFQGGIVPTYAVIVREYFSPQRGRRPGRHRAVVDAVRHGDRRLDVGRGLRPHRVLPRGIGERDRLEHADDRHRGLLVLRRRGRDRVAYA